MEMETQNILGPLERMLKLGLKSRIPIAIQSSIVCSAANGELIVLFCNRKLPYTVILRGWFIMDLLHSDVFV